MEAVSMTLSLRVAVAIVALLWPHAALSQGQPDAQPKPRPPAAKPAAPPATTVKSDTRIYLFRGLLNVFSFGMDTLQERLAAMGLNAEVSNHNAWFPVASQIIEDRKRGLDYPVVLIGHSLGADVLFSLTERLEKENVPVRLVVFFDPTVTLEVPGNVEYALNLYQTGAFGRKVLAAKRFKGELVNHYVGDDASIGHTSIDKSEKLHALVIDKIMKVAVGPVQRKRTTPAKLRTTAPTAGVERPASAAPSVAVEPKPSAAPRATAAPKRAAEPKSSAAPKPAAEPKPAAPAPAASAAAGAAPSQPPEAVSPAPSRPAPPSPRPDPSLLVPRI
jgi:hypothetical protein